MTLYDATGAPSWMLDPETRFGAVTFVSRVAADANIEKMKQGVRARFPGEAPPDALALIAADRLLTRGANENTQQFAGRLSAAFDAWAAAGLRRGVLEEVYWLTYDPAVTYPTNVPILAIVGGDTKRSTWDVLYSTSDPRRPSRARVSPANWNWDGQQYGRRAWLIVYCHLVALGRSGSAASTTAVVSDFTTITGLSGMSAADVGNYLTLSGAASSANNGTWQIVEVLSASSVAAAIVGGVAGDANNGAIAWSVSVYQGTAPAPVAGCPGLRADGNTSAMSGQYAGATLTAGLTNPPDVTQMQAVTRTFKSATTWYPWFLFCFGGGDGTAGWEFSPSSSQGSGNPDGTWLHWSKIVGGTQVYARTTGVQLGYLDAPCDGTGFYVHATVPTGT